MYSKVIFGNFGKFVNQQRVEFAKSWSILEGSTYGRVAVHLGVAHPLLADNELGTVVCPLPSVLRFSLSLQSWLAYARITAR